MKVFIDCGAYDGDSIEQFYNWFKLIDDPTEYNIFAFEPNPTVMAKAKERLTNKKVVFSDNAVWIENGTKEFSVYDVGSTLMKSKSTWDKGVKIEVDTIDFSEWIKQFENDYVFVKLDCEGAEFPILEKMIQDDTLKVIDLLAVEFHPNKVSDYTTTDKNNLIEKIKQQGIKLYEWH